MSGASRAGDPAFVAAYTAAYESGVAAVKTSLPPALVEHVDDTPMMTACCAGALAAVMGTLVGLIGIDKATELGRLCIDSIVAKRAEIEADGPPRAR